MLNFEKPRALILVCIISHKSQDPYGTFYLIPRMMTLLFGSKVKPFSEQLGSFLFENSMKFELLNFYLFCFVSKTFSRLLYILALDFFFVLGEGKVF